MSKAYLLFIIVYIFALTFGTPIIDGEDVGEVKQKGNKVIVTGQKKYPFVVHLSIFYTRDNKNKKIICVGVIIGRNSLLTAGHCLFNIPNPKIAVHAGIVDTKSEANGGQKIAAKDFYIHENYVHTCEMGDGRCCFGDNDLAIIWTQEDFRLGSTIKKAVLNKKLDKLIGKKGWIMGWGVNNAGVLPSMLQRGAMKIVPKQECTKINQNIYVNDKVLCLGPVSKATRANRGDSGGPFVSNDKVYGLSSITVFEIPCQNRGLDLFTNVAVYTDWINNNLIAGPPKERKNPKRPRLS